MNNNESNNLEGAPAPTNVITGSADTTPKKVPEEVEAYVDELLLLGGDLQLAESGIEDALLKNDVYRMQAESDDIDKIKDKYNSTYLKFTSTCRRLDIDTSECDDRRAKFLVLFKRLKASTFSVLHPPSLSKSVNPAANGDDNSRLKLAKIEVKDFDGKIAEWSQWKAVFETFVHHNTKYSHFEKHQILRSKLKGEPYHLIEEIPLDETNSASYDDAWKALLDQFDDPLERVSRYLLALSNVPSNCKSLKSLVTHFRANAVPLRMVFQKHPEIDVFSQFMIHAFLQKADKGANLDWQRELQKKEVLSTFDEFIKHMQGRCKSYDRAMSNNNTNASTSSKSSSASNSKGVSMATTKAQLLPRKSKPNGCLYCHKPHPVHTCADFKALPNLERFKFIQRKQVCRKCLRGYCERTCQFYCNICKKGHNTLVHVDSFVSNKEAPKTDSSTSQPGKNSISLLPINLEESVKPIDSSIQREISNEISDKFNLMGVGWSGSLVTDNLLALLATAVIKVTNSAGEQILARALLDNASQFNFITAAFAKKLNLTPFFSTTYIKGIDSMASSAKQSVLLIFSSCHSNFQTSIKCIIVDEIIDLIPSQYFSIEKWNFPSYITLADPEFNKPQPVDLLIGLGAFWKIIQPHFKNIGTGLPKLIATKLGWLVSGEMNLVVADKSNSYFTFLNSECVLSKTIQQFWFLDETPSDHLSFEAVECERIYKKTTYRKKEDKKFVVCHPYQISPEKLGTSKPQALKQFLYLEKKLTKNPILGKAYSKDIQDYKNKGQMRLVLNDNGDGYYMPHHAILKESSTSTSHRIVFNASQLTSSGLSLNNCIIVGPVVQSDLFSILLRARMHVYVFTADIQQMYRQIWMHECDVKYQKILWRDSPEEEIQTYEMLTVTFGLASAPYLATRCLKELAETDGSQYPAAQNTLLYDFYVDDVFSGGDNLADVIEKRKQLTELLASAGFHLRKWCANDPAILQGISTDELETNFPLYSGSEFAVKTLGIIFIPKDDVYKVWVHIESISSPTKRQVLSIISTIFDPLGFLGPVLILAKIMMQQLWAAQNGTLGWADLVPPSILPQWVEFSTQLSILNDLCVPRCAKRIDNPTIIELHGFCDSSESAYGAVFYLRSITNGQVSVNLLCSKTRVAPLKKRPIAQLELCAALLLSELYQKVIAALDKTIKINCVRLWSDNTTVLCWIKSLHSRWIVFVANRVKKIQEKTNLCTWDYVNTNQNPADILSRGLLPSQFKTFQIWWKGPEWLHNSNPFTTEVKFQPSNNFLNDFEIRNSRKGFCATIVKNTIFSYFSTFKKLVRSVAWYFRFFMHLDKMGPHLTGPLQCFELRHATTVLIKIVQKESFPDELKCLDNGKNIDLKSRLISLSPFLDAQGVIRVGGRLQESELTFEQRFQIVLPSNHIFTKYLIKHEHLLNFHAGPQLMRSILRRKWWILSINRAIRSCTLNCHSCIRMKADTQSQMMANLPKARVVPSRPFLKCGVDYAGPIQLLRLKDRGKVILQAYICVFVCFTTKALHLELVSDLTTECFIAALKRFISRRGIPLEINSDNGTTFVGAAKQIKQLKEFFSNNSGSICNFASSLNIHWQFIPPRAPHFGGLWEAGVKSVKKYLETTLKGSKFTYEQYLTFLTQIEACLNSRPLYLESSDPNEPGALTPGHFLIGGPITALPNKDLADIPANRLKHWHLLEQKSQYFWKKWSRDYLNTLQQRSKWRQMKNNLKIDDVVLVIEDNIPPTQWPLAVITALHPNKDGLVRKVTVRMRTGDYKKLLDPKIPVTTSEFVRPITKLVYLPTDSNDEL